ncbi:MAG TPA: hypothetical protein VER11_10930 [Polyangiaceae bacterium]|nr:hypothetical protein [Polyangiaceae bacterium]
MFPLLLLIMFGCWPRASENYDDWRWFVLVMASGALGAYIHVGRSVGAYIGNDALIRSWLYWYLLRIPIGAALALIVYFLMQSLPSGGQKDLAAQFKMVGVAALAGLFSDGTIKKLNDWFNMLFRAKDDSLKDGLDESAAKRPLLRGVAPEPLPRTGGTVTIQGEHFRESTQVIVDGKICTPRTIREALLSFDLKPEELVGKKALTVQVFTPDTGDAKLWYFSDPASLKLDPEPPKGDPASRPSATGPQS